MIELFLSVERYRYVIRAGQFSWMQVLIESACCVTLSSLWVLVVQTLLMNI